MEPSLLVLLVEASADVAERMDSLRREGHDPSFEMQPTSRTQARARVESLKPNAIVVDMPEVDASTVDLVADLAGSGAAILVLLGAAPYESMVEDIAAVMHAGAQDVLPISELDARSLAAHLKRAMDRRAAEADQPRVRALQAQLIQAQKMEAVGRLAGGIAHDFNNILTTIVSFAGFVRDDTAPNDPRRADVAEVLRAADKAKTLTSQLLTFSRRQPVEPHNVELNELMMNVDKLLRRTLGHDIEIITLPAEQPVFVRLDPVQFEQAIMNLVVNARDAMPEGGTLTMEVSALHDDEKQRVGRVEVSVADTGVGMDRETLDRIFEPFFTTKVAGKGSGLGLAMCYGFVHQASGTITAESEPGEGTTFRIRLPVVDSARMSKRPSSDVPSDVAGTETILVAEDEGAVLRAVRRMLTKHGYTVVGASNGHEGVNVFDKNHQSVKLLLTDWVMPRMGGAELARRIRKKAPNLPVLYMSGYIEDVDEAVLEARGVEFLRKPFVERTLLEKVRVLLDAAPAAGSADGAD